MWKEQATEVESGVSQVYVELMNPELYSCPRELSVMIECLIAALPKVVATEHSKMASGTEELHF